jgi:hypothetical protein
MGMRQKYFKRMNRYTLFQLTFVFVPIVTANLYNLAYTWSGRQVFWIDLESLLVTCSVLICHCVIIFRSEKEYLLEVFEFDRNDEKMFRQGPKLELEGETKELVDQIMKCGIDDETRRKIRQMTKYQKVAVLQAIYTGNNGDRFRLKHGRGHEFTTKHPQSPRQHEFTDLSDPYIESRPNKLVSPSNGKMTRMFYSSSSEDAKRVEEAKELHERQNQLASLYDAIRQDTSRVVGDVDEIRMSSV